MVSIRRRDLLMAGLAIPAMTTLGLRWATAAPAAGAVDAHCHLFNASDLPIRGFLRRVVFEDYEDQEAPQALRLPSPLAALIATLARFLSVGVISADEEFAQLTGAAVALSTTFDPFSPEAQRAFEDALRSVLAGGARELGTEAPVPQSSIDALREAIEGELAVDPQALTAPGADSAAPTASRLFVSSGLIGRTARWAAWLRSPRFRLVERAVELYGGNGGVSFFTPALVDYDNWLDDTPRSNLASQIKVMEAVQKAAFQRLNIFVHSLAPFDPWREAFDVDAGRSPTALDLAREAVEERGFVGVKLYPPMGFLPTNNAASGLTYPDGSGPGFAAKIDDALERLFVWAEGAGVPLLAHAANTNGAGKEYSERANPAGWEAVLTRHPNLRLNLAHFGGFDEVAGGDPWEEATGRLFSLFPNTYTDLSYLSESLPSASPQRRAYIADQIRAFLLRFPGSDLRLVYGSDWIMLGREADHQLYFESVQTLLGRAGVLPQQWANISRANAIRLYGLRAGEPGRMRLEAWYGRSGLDAAALTQFD